MDKDLVKVLLSQGWKQSKIAKEMGVTQSAVAQIVKKYNLGGSNEKLS